MTALEVTPPMGLALPRQQPWAVVERPATSAELSVAPELAEAPLQYFGWGEGNFEHGQSYDVGEPGLGFQYRRGAALMALKRELVGRGTTRAVKPKLPVFGDAMRNAVADFQTAFGMAKTGVVDYVFCYRLFWCVAATSSSDRGPSAVDVQAEHAIPNNYLAKLLSLESGYYPAAGNTGGDCGLAQIHDPADFGEAFDPAYAIGWAAGHLVAQHAIMSQIGTTADAWWPQRYTLRWHAAIAAHNAPSLADDWLRAGCPSLGGPVIKVGAREYPAWEWLGGTYVPFVLKQRCY